MSFLRVRNNENELICGRQSILPRRYVRSMEAYWDLNPKIISYFKTQFRLSVWSRQWQQSFKSKKKKKKMERTQHVACNNFSGVELRLCWSADCQIRPTLILLFSWYPRKGKRWNCKMLLYQWRIFFFFKKKIFDAVLLIIIITVFHIFDIFIF
jgi:hypothetical protein